MPSEEEINQQQELLAIYRGNVSLFLRQQAELGSAHTPPGVVNGLREARFHIQRIKQTLSSWNVQVEEHPDDGPPSYKDFLEWLANRGRETQSVPRQSGSRGTQTASVKSANAAQSSIKITGVIADEVSVPRNDGTRGSALYRVPLQLSAYPTTEWAELFAATWNRPPQFTTVHRPGIARVVGDRVILDGTTIEEVEEYHRDTLVLVIRHVNQTIAERDVIRQTQLAVSTDGEKQHMETVREVSKRLKFN
jgi:hypothetical protein